mmetsp:Transcript_25122/g.84384  ORF Transcript_25122/g.84384 Transcript_25122/m.84384 type:complete len:243 (-) Transcript_25122:2549-3277(-)
MRWTASWRNSDWASFCDSLTRRSVTRLDAGKSRCTSSNHGTPHSWHSASAAPRAEALRRLCWAPSKRRQSSCSTRSAASRRAVATASFAASRCPAPRSEASRRGSRRWPCSSQLGRCPRRASRRTRRPRRRAGAGTLAPAEEPSPRSLGTYTALDGTRRSRPKQRRLAGRARTPRRRRRLGRQRARRRSRWLRTRGRCPASRRTSSTARPPKNLRRRRRRLRRGERRGRGRLLLPRISGGGQ